MDAMLPREYCGKLVGSQNAAPLPRLLWMMPNACQLLQRQINNEQLYRI
jgi:hypothetical protein